MDWSMDIDDETLVDSLNMEAQQFRQASNLAMNGNSPYNSTNLPSSDWLVDEKIDGASASNQAVAIVIDTNFFISHLGLLRDLLEVLRSPSNKMFLLVPYVVIKELDGLKNRKETRAVSGDALSRVMNVSISDCARQSILFLYNTFNQKHPFCRGQKITDILPGVNTESLNNDDLILECCRFYQNDAKKSTIAVLLSNDKNLCIKATIHGIESVCGFRGDSKGLLTEINSKMRLSSFVAKASSSPQPQHSRNSTHMSQPVVRGNSHHTHNGDVDMLLEHHPEEVFDRHTRRLSEVSLVVEIHTFLLDNLKEVMMRLYAEHYGENSQPYKPLVELVDCFQLLEDNKEVFASILAEDCKQHMGQLKWISKAMSKSIRLRKFELTFGELELILRYTERILQSAGSTEVTTNRFKGFHKMIISCIALN